MAQIPMIGRPINHSAFPVAFAALRSEWERIATEYAEARQTAIAKAHTAYNFDDKHQYDLWNEVFWAEMVEPRKARQAALGAAHEVFEAAIQPPDTTQGL